MTNEIKIMTRPLPGTAVQIESQEMVTTWANQNSVMLPASWHLGDWLVEIELDCFVVPKDLFHFLFIEHDPDYLTCFCYARSDYECGCANSLAYGILSDLN